VGAKLIDHKHYVDKHGDDTPQVRGWRQGYRTINS